MTQPSTGRSRQTRRRLPPGRLLVVHRVRLRLPSRAAAGGPAPAVRCEHRGTARHDDRVPALRRRRRHGRRPPGHHGQRHRQPRHGEGLRGRRLQRGGHRRHRRHRHRARPALPGRARALREDRGRHHVARGQGQPPRLDDPGQPRAGDAGPDGRADVCRLRPRVGHRPHLLLRRHGRLLRRGRPPLARVRVRCSPEAPSRSCGVRASRSSRPSRSPSRRSTTPPTTTRPPAVPTSAARSGRPWPIVDHSGARFVAAGRPRGTCRAHRRRPP